MTSRPTLTLCRCATRTNPHLLRANPGEADVLWLDTDSGQVYGSDSEETTAFRSWLVG